MKLIVVTHDLQPTNWHLMPWRTVCEVVTRLQTLGHETRLISLGERKCGLSGGGIPSDTMELPNANVHEFKKALAALVVECQPEVIFWPITWREPRKRTRAAGELGVPLVAYIPGGVYDLNAVLYAMRHIGIRKALPYLAEVLSPKPAQLNTLSKNNFREVIALSDLTASVVNSSGWPKDKVRVIYPGRDQSASMETNLSLPAQLEATLQGKRYYLFLGPPSAIRGIFELLSAFDQLAKQRPDIDLVCLFRSDGTNEEETVARKLTSLTHPDRVHAVWESLDRPALHSFISKCHAIIMPFVLVPSEIPLGIIEALGWGKPVVSTVSGGTGVFVDKFGLTAKVGDVHALSKSLAHLADDKDLYNRLSASAREIHLKHPTWDQTANDWLKVGERAAAGQNIALSG